ncbi:arginine N-succinyltransferase [Zooshikella ganghwensis]|uniref:Arginine N-succinyltransferase n=1 Tax=Zooshikella ganghwensis TaxID=202772 RepID=A0A4P9VMK0_9GAMM|nr:arginine N-succinyltransferase [Zooshikella ganghwensis]RDH44573.1 arginine N-succinyltransferase [Zooshikella ganghwensis]
MMIIRPINQNDYERLYELAEKTGTGFTSLQPNEEQLKQKITVSEAAIAMDEPESPGEETYLFVLEDTATHQVVGICGVAAAVGLSEPWYNYHLGTLVHSSRELKVHNIVHTLRLSNDHTGYTELCSLFLDPEYRHSGNGSLLSKSRYAFMAQFPNRFGKQVCAEMRGVSDDEGRSPFWEALGRPFFSMDFSHADYLTGIGEKVFIAELMPKHLIYTNLLPESAQAVIGEVHENTRPALRMLENEGFRYEGYVDIFDAGPTVTCHFDDIRAIRASREVKVKVTSALPSSDTTFVISNTLLNDFRCGMLPLVESNGTVAISPEDAAELKLNDGDHARIFELSSGSEQQ